MALVNAPAAVARVLFDESHGEAWTISRERAAALQPAHPQDSSYADAADALRGRELTVAAHRHGPLDAHALADADVLVIAHPSEATWEKTDGASPVFADAEIDAIEAWVRAGGGLVVLGETEQAKYGTNVDRLLARFGLGVATTTVYDYTHAHTGNPAWVLAQRAAARSTVGGADLLARVERAAFYRAGALELRNGATALLQTSAQADPAGAPLLAATTAGAGRVVLFADSDLFGDDCLGDLDHRALWLDTITWAAQSAFAAAGGTPAASPVLADPHWATLKAEVDALRLLQEPDGSVDTATHDAADLAARVGRIADAVAALAPHFPHQAAYVEATVADLHRWVADGFPRPDFTGALEHFRPDLHREDGIEHLVVFPMYTQNGSRDTRFEALVVRVPWPAWLAELERTRYDNPKFVPVTFVDRTAGYDSECAVLFPETFSTGERKPTVNHFGGIFCDREAERFRRVCGAAVEVLGVNLPADAAALLASPRISQEAFVLWDLVHDRAHSRGDLPFDPFMIRQRMPYWMYSLEELRCDLTAFSEAVGLEAEGFAFARHVQTAILFDRLFRFPVTGSRVRNYDGLGGQLLFAFLHERGTIRWTDNRLTIDWNDVADGVVALRAKVEALYRSGIDLPKVRYWMTAHDLVSSYVAPAVTSVWTGGARALHEEPDPKRWIDAVQDDEFPLSVFYTQLQPKLEPALVAA
ncbi:hypothetical protein GKE82_05725 [Conexibacter sp. W3-3-2]|uniref:DUF6421 family protein n=1 Tax=Conexibacter sp. W3-3-2 TaxID=2675227 RepID=UPI001325A41E|nr:DUF6421 family protein [Conexibacter sp. W3-3-2]MTD43817.1 hypothetical protein [Conexibacter sp. W3-3-2]